MGDKSSFVEVDGIPLRSEYVSSSWSENLTPYLVGSPKQFIVYQGEYHCIRYGCEGCPHVQGCQSSDSKAQTTVLSSTRRMIGEELRPFLVLVLKEGFVFAKPSDPKYQGVVSDRFFPMELWGHPEQDKCLDRYNRHYLLQDPIRTKFRVMKGQIRYYGSVEEFNASPYSKYFGIYAEYKSEKFVNSLDYSAIEPRVNAIVSGEPEWLKVFEGQDKVVVREVEVPDSFSPENIVRLRGKTFCIVLGELDKEHACFENQCSSCRGKESCKVIRNFSKKVAGDFHGKNADAFFDGAYSRETDKDKKKGIRAVGKIYGLALVYGGNAYTFMKNGYEKEEAQKLVDSYFAKLSVLSARIAGLTRDIKTTGLVYNNFGRVRDVSKQALSGKWPLINSAVNQGLNFPIQSTSADMLKLSMIRVLEWATERAVNSLYGLNAPKKLVAEDVVLDFSLLMSVHDELVNLTKRSKYFDTVAELYKVMQTQDILDEFGASFSLEMDLEYDDYGSYTSREGFEQALIYLHTILDDIMCEEDLGEMNALLLDGSNLPDRSVFDKLSEYEPNVEGSILLVVSSDKGYYVHNNMYPLDVLEEVFGSLTPIEFKPRE